MNTAAGRELDALIAEKVMDKHPVVGDWMGLATYRLVEEGKPLPYYSETWEGMRLVVERMKELGFACRMSVYQTGRFFVIFWVQGGPTKASQSGETMPHAVCLAALEALNEPPSQ